MKTTEPLTESSHSNPGSAGTAVDPICGMEVETASALSAEKDGQTFYFCSAGCQTKFRGQSLPPNAVEAEGAHGCCGSSHVAPAEPPAPAVTAAQHTCPMHPEVQSDRPGDCPKCGMALEPVSPVPAASSKTIYTCPMHPQIEQDHPGDCPICGMALEPEVIAGSSQELIPEVGQRHAPIRLLKVGKLHFHRRSEACPRHLRRSRKRFLSCDLLLVGQAASLVRVIP